jgi:DNA-binding NtrC family response regulator
LLRFLQEKTIERLGGVKLIPLDVRVLAATHIDLERLISGNRFREDLYYRLNVLRIEVPPLRHRQGDIELLANSMLEKFASRAKRRIRGFSCAALDWMNFYEWPGNVRELINRVQRAAVMCEGRLVSVADLGFERRTSPRSALKLASSRKQAEQEAIRDALARFRTMTQASAELGVSRMTLYRLMAKYGMTRDGSSEAS